MTPVEGVIVGSYVLRHRISDGGMGSVWAAEHVTLHYDAAVKFLASSCRDQAARARFELEARTIARISSPHVPRVFDQGTCDDGTPYLVMELVGGMDLKRWVAEHGCMTLSQLTRLVDHVCLAMTAAHELGIVHRDIKPENIILSGGDLDFHATLIDFGIAKCTLLSKSSPHLTQVGSTIGTPSYMSPEQLTAAESVDERSDIWSLGVVAYWVLTGTLPFEGESFAAVCCAIQASHATPVSELRPALPCELDEWFERVLSRVPEQRMQSAALMSRMLHVAAARPLEWSRQFPIAREPSGRSGPLADSSIGGTAPGPALSIAPHRRDNIVSGIAGAALTLLAVIGISKILAPTYAGATTNLPSTVTTVATTVATTAAEPAPPPVIEVPSAPIELEEPHAVTPTPEPRVEVAVPKSPPAVARRPSVKAVASAVPIPPPLPPPAPVLVTTDAGAPDSGAPPNPSDWHPRDELGEP